MEKSCEFSTVRTSLCNVLWDEYGLSEILELRPTKYLQFQDFVFLVRINVSK